MTRRAPAPCEVVVLNRQRQRRVDPRAVARFVERLTRALPPPGPHSVAVCLVSDARIRGYNRLYRDHDAATDVLSFPCGPEAAMPGESVLGDIVISVPTAARQARRRGRSLARELDALALHGYLHLLGHDHEVDGGAMLALERRLWRRLRRGRS